jgi:glutathione S-transferase
MMKLWGRATSINVQKAVWALEEIGLDYERVDLGGPFGGLDDPAYRALNPNGRVPTLQDGELVLWESQAIVRYLAARHGAGSLWDEDPGRRALSDCWMDWTMGTPLPDLTTIFWHTVRLPAAQRDHAAVAAAAKRLGEVLAVPEAHLADRPFVAGERLTIGDIALGALFYRYFAFDIERPALPNLSAYYERLTARPAYQASIMTSFEPLRVKE